jgi:hypothetical protein
MRSGCQVVIDLFCKSFLQLIWGNIASVDRNHSEASRKLDQNVTPSPFFHRDPLAILMSHTSPSARMTPDNATLKLRAARARFLNAGN